MDLATHWPDLQIVQQLLHKVPWFHLCTLLDKVKDPAERDWHVRAALQHAWSRNVLVMQIETDAYHRQGKALTNFEAKLPKPQSDLVRVCRAPAAALLNVGGEEFLVDLRGCRQAFVRLTSGRHNSGSRSSKPSIGGCGRAAAAMWLDDKPGMWPLARPDILGQPRAPNTLKRRWIRAFSGVLRAPRTDEA